MRRRFVVACTLLLSLASVPTLATALQPADILKLLKQANEEFNTVGASRSAAFKEFLALLPKDENGDYVVEGDISKTRAEVVDWVKQFEEGVPDGPANPEAKFNLVDGKLDIFPRGERRITYAIDRASFPNDNAADEVASRLDTATADWEAACKDDCKIDFVEVAMNTEGSDRPYFLVEFRDSNRAFIARAFFRSYPPERRKLTIDPTFFTSRYEKTGVLTHEVGHILGLRHEHIDGVPGCPTEGGGWTAVTGYDGDSAMHYFCGGGGSREMTISQLDSEAITKIYNEN